MNQDGNDYQDFWCVLHEEVSAGASFLSVVSSPAISSGSQQTCWEAGCLLGRVRATDTSCFVKSKSLQCPASLSLCFHSSVFSLSPNQQSFSSLLLKPIALLRSLAHRLLVGNQVRASLPSSSLTPFKHQTISSLSFSLNLPNCYRFLVELLQTVDRLSHWRLLFVKSNLLILLTVPKHLQLN